MAPHTKGGPYKSELHFTRLALLLVSENTGITRCTATEEKCILARWKNVEITRNLPLQEMAQTQ
jgi:hypothetical protein